MCLLVSYPIQWMYHVNLRKELQTYLHELKGKPHEGFEIHVGDHIRPRAYEKVIKIVSIKKTILFYLFLKLPNQSSSL